MSDFMLHELAALGDWKQIEVLFRVNGVKDINLQDEDFEGQTALHWAVRKGNIKCCEVLLEQGADPSIQMYQGWTPAHCAAEIGQLDILKLLQHHSALMTTKDISGATPKQLARIYNHDECISFLHEIEEFEKMSETANEVEMGNNHLELNPQLSIKKSKGQRPRNASTSLTMPRTENNKDRRTHIQRKVR